MKWYSVQKYNGLNISFHWIVININLWNTAAHIKTVYLVSLQPPLEVLTCYIICLIGPGIGETLSGLNVDWSIFSKVSTPSHLLSHNLKRFPKFDVFCLYRH